MFSLQNIFPDHDTMVFPSRLMATLMTVAAWPMRVEWHVPESMSHTLWALATF